MRPYKNIMSSSIELSNSEIVKAFPPTVIYIIENKDIFYVGMRTLDYKLEGATLKIKNREVCVRYKGNPVVGFGSSGVYGLERWLGKLRGKIAENPSHYIRLVDILNNKYKVYGIHSNLYRSVKTYEDIVKDAPYFKEKWAACARWRKDEKDRLFTNSFSYQVKEILERRQKILFAIKLRRTSVLRLPKMTAF